MEAAAAAPTCRSEGFRGLGFREDTPAGDQSRTRIVWRRGQGAEGAWAAAARGGYRKRSKAVRAKVLNELRRQPQIVGHSWDSRMSS